jgi:hypothetical protein
VKSGREIAWPTTFLVAACASMILGYIGIDHQLAVHPASDLGRHWPDILYYDLQLFVLGSGPLDSPGPFTIPLQIARFLAPATAVLALAEALKLVLGDQLRSWRAAHSRNHTIVCGDSPAAFRLAEQIRQDGQKVILITPVQLARRPGASSLLQVQGDLDDPEILRAAGISRASAIYSCAADSSANAAVALRAREAVRRRATVFEAYAQVDNAELCAALRARRVGVSTDPNFRLDFFSLDDIAATVLLDSEHPAQARTEQARTEQASTEQPSTEQPSTLIVGFGSFAQAVLREIGRRSYSSGSKSLVTIAAAGSAEPVNDFLRHHSWLQAHCQVTVLSEVPADPAGPPLGRTLVCLPDSEDALRVALQEVRAARGSTRVVACLDQRAPFFDALADREGLLDNVRGGLSIFGILDAACVPGLLRMRTLDMIARAIHDDYVASCRRRGDTPALNPSMRPWQDLPETLQRSNIAQAENVGSKLAMIHAVLVPLIDDSIFEFTPQELEELAQSEHQRWVADRLGEGFTFGSVRTARQHPNIIAWEMLSDDGKDKDRSAVRALPQILRAAGFQILRMAKIPQ